MVGPHGLDDLGPDRHDGVKRAQRVLENHGNVAAAHLAHALERARQQIFAIKHNLALIGHLLFMLQ